MTTVHIYNHEHLRRKTGISWKKHMHNKTSQAYHLREFCGGGNSEPNATLHNIKCHVSVNQQHHVQLKPSHLFPKETPDIKSTATMTAKA
jgi:hypothetical protein